MIEERRCLNCGSLLKGRSDKRFCHDQCRSRHNYDQKSQDNLNLIREINNSLKKNWDILKTLNINGETKISKRTMAIQGFNFDYFTSAYSIEGKEKYFYCYEMGYQVINDSEILLVEKG
nr:hypothetical protein [Pedobacter panaciterrae]